ncbi:MAG: efflux RND transporter permease subunit, partial [Candidatus Krumholzibacteria bacterium]|nr:efflux RND transporter permease subunit [Candidatus Krumholzibacteria bacterium]
ALTVSISLLASLIVALMLIPMISSLQGRPPVDPLKVFGNVDETPKKRRKLTRAFVRGWSVATQTVPVFLLRLSSKLGRVLQVAARTMMRPGLAAFAALYGAVERRYQPALSWCLNHRGVFLTTMAILFGISVGASRFLGAELIPQFSQGEFSFNVRLPEGSPLNATDAKLAEMEEMVAVVPGVESYFTSVGVASRLGSNKKNKDKNIGQINVALSEKGNKKNEERVVESLRDKFSSIGDLDFKFARPMYFTLQTPVEVEIYGYNLESLRNVSDQFEGELSRIPGIKDVKTTMEVGNPEINVVFDRDRLSSFSLSLDDVSNRLKTKIQGEVPTKFKERELQVDIRVRTSAWQAENVDELKALVVGEREGAPISLGTVANIDVARGLSQITRISQQRAAVVSGNLSGRDLASVSEDIETVINRTALPAGVTVELGGQNQELNRSFRSLVFALLLAIFLVYLVMAAQFESFVHPFIILFTVPLGAIGVVWMLLVTGQSLSVVVFIGVIMLSGIVVNNGIVLIDYINQLRRGGMEKMKALREAGLVRLRPIIMTTLTTVLGLLPMALGLGEGAEIRAPMALTVIGGLLGATALTLLVIPALYSLVARGK